MQATGRSEEIKQEQAETVKIYAQFMTAKEADYLDMAHSFCCQDECALNALAIDNPLEYTTLYLEGSMQTWVDAEDSLEPW